MRRGEDSTGGERAMPQPPYSSSPHKGHAVNLLDVVGTKRDFNDPTLKFTTYDLYLYSGGYTTRGSTTYRVLHTEYCPKDLKCETQLQSVEFQTRGCL